MLARRSCKIRREKHPIAFLKVVEGNEIYNFPIDRNVHFSSRFWSYTRPNQGTAKRVSRSAPHRAAARRRASRLHHARLGFRAAHACRDHLGDRAPRCPRLHAPREPLEVIPPRTACRPAGRRPTDRRSRPCRTDRASYRGRRSPQGTSPSAPWSQASTCAALKGGRCSFLDAPDPPRYAELPALAMPSTPPPSSSLSARGRHGLSTPTGLRAPTEASPAALNPDRALTSPEQAPPRSPSGCAAGGHRRSPLHPVQPPNRA
jgi:hypothetical protein